LLGNKVEEFLDESSMMIETSNVSGICVTQEPPRLVVQEPDVVFDEFGLKDSHVEIVEKLSLHIKGFAASPLPPSKMPHGAKRWQPELEEFTVDFLLAAHVKPALTPP
jgi:hypothetical protein